MKTILTTLFSVSILATMAIAGPGCSGYKEVTLAEQKSHAHEVLVVEIDGMELFQLTNQEGKIFFKIRNLFGEEVAQSLDKEQLAEQYPKVYKALLESRFSAGQIPSAPKVPYLLQKLYSVRGSFTC